MNCNTYHILGKKVEITLKDETIIPETFGDFISLDNDEGIQIAFESNAEEKGCYGIGYLAEQNKKLKTVFFSQKDRSQLLYAYEDDYSDLKLQIDDACTKEILSELLMAGFYSYVSVEDSLLLHASAVRHKDQAIVFVAASGTGKTTQAELWAKYKEADILNGDKVFLKKEDEQIRAWGSPWSGSSPYAKNASAPLSAILVLEQAKENSIQKLSDFEILEKVVPHVFFPNWDSECERSVLAFLDEVLCSIDVYLLKCRPDEDAVRLVESILFEKIL